MAYKLANAINIAKRDSLTEQPEQARLIFKWGG